MKTYILRAACALLIATTGASLLAQGGIIRREEPPQTERETQRFGVNYSGPWRPDGQSGNTRVIGTVVDITQTPVAKAVVQLRNLDTGNVEQTAEANDLGEYAFELETSGTFVVEMVMVDGAVLALSNAGALARYETLNTVVMLPGRWDYATRNMVLGSNVTNYFGMSSAMSMTAATIGLAADTNIVPVNPGVPVSPY